MIRHSTIYILLTVIMYLLVQGTHNARAQSFGAENRASIDPAFLSRFTDENYWRGLSPLLHIYDKTLASTSQVLQIEEDQEDILRSLIIKEGYVAIEEVFDDIDLLSRLQATINRFHELKIPVQFCYVYDEFWLLFMQLHKVIGSLLGNNYKRLPDFWSWRIATNDDSGGWKLHRDKDANLDLLWENGLPKALSVWIALSDATNLNSCMYVLPADRDPSYLTKHQLNYNNQSGNIWPELLPSVRALPVPAGSVLMWNQRLWHWGGRASSRADQPRMSVSIEFQSGSVAPFNIPLSNPLKFPKFEERIQLIMKQTLQYKHMYPLDVEVEQLAREYLTILPFANEDL